MSRRTTSLAVASLAAASFVTFDPAPASAQVQKDHVDYALEIAENAVVNEWSSSTEGGCYVNWEEPSETHPAWSASTKAACFFTLSLRKAMGYSPADLYNMWDSTSPTSDYYFQLISMSPALGAPTPWVETHFRRVTKAVDIQKGDVLVVGLVREDGDEDGDGIEDEVLYSGHTVMITGPAVELTRQIMPRYSGTKQYMVPIVDSTNSPHGCNLGEYSDSRCATGEGGIGVGYMRVYTDSSTDILLGYTWSLTSSLKSYESPSKQPYRIARLVKLPPPESTEPPPPPP
ncbi:hypothetical protein WMF31_16585 [Sorangium sp. So ce1036]|uniref:hypothetical protein n=1 Tax=Sorangium sp. So ce1036 TaxID=3133328 RepID=UPI003F0E4142